MSFLLVSAMVAVGAVGALGVLPRALRWMRRRRARQAWLELSPRLELPLSEGANERLLSGRYRGHPMEVRLTLHGTSQVRVPLKTSLPAGLRLSRQEPGSTPRPRRGPRDIQVGDPEMDKAFLIEGKNPAAVIRLLREPGVRDALLALQTESPRALITENEVLAPMEGPVQEERCRRTLRSTALLTSALLEAMARHEELAVKAREQVRRELPPVPGPRPTVPQKDGSLSLAFVRDEFARRLRIHRWFGTIPMVTGLPLFCCVAAGRTVLAELGLSLTYCLLTALGLFVGGLLGHHVISRKILLCPACGQDVIEPDPEKQEFLKKGEDGITLTLTLSTDICPHCRTVLS